MIFKKRIKAAAIMQMGEIYWLPAPSNHHDIICSLKHVGIKYTPLARTRDQGFITNTGKFVGRIEAAAIAQASGQLIRPIQTYELFSENLW